MVNLGWHVRDPEPLESSMGPRVSTRTPQDSTEVGHGHSQLKACIYYQNLMEKTDTRLFIQQQVGVREMSALASNLQDQLLSVPLLPAGAYFPPGQLPLPCPLISPGGV